MCYRKAVSQIRFEVQQIDTLLESYKSLLAKCKEKEPDLIEITAIASVLHSFYNGIENMFLSITRRIDNIVPSGSHWHRDLLTRMTEDIDVKQSVISDDSKEKLADYLGFRHFFRHSYSFFLEWDELKKLVHPLRDVWTQVKTEIESFLDNLKCYSESI